MKYLKELQQKKLFTLEDVAKLTGNTMTAKSLLQNYKKAGYITSIRRNLYGALDLASGNIIADRFEIASQASDSAYISCHTALEFYGVANQVFYEVTISSESSISQFMFDGVTYSSRRSRMKDGVVTVPYNSLIRVTDIDRTIIDCIHNIELAGGLEELLQCLKAVPQVSESLLLKYLGLYDEKYLWQKAGFILELFKDQLNISDSFFEKCESSIGARKNYLETGTENRFNRKWKLYVPENTQTMIGEGGEELV